MKREGEAKESTPLFQKSRKRNVDPGGVVYFLLEVRGVRGGGAFMGRSSCADPVENWRI